MATMKEAASWCTQRLRARGYEVFAANPNADEVEGDRCYHDLKSIPGGVEAVVIGTRPAVAEDTIRRATYPGGCEPGVAGLTGSSAV